MTKPIAALLTFAIVLVASEAKAQKFRRSGQTVITQATPATPSVMRTAQGTYSASPSQMVNSSAAPGATYSTPFAPAAPSRVYNYSYYASPQPARTYVGYGNDDFPFYGVP